MAKAYQLTDADAALRDCIPEESPTGNSTNRDPRLSLPDDRLHETLLNLFRKRVDPLIRIIHWPSFQERCSTFRSNRGPYSETGYSLQQQGSYQSVPIVPSQGNSPYPQVSGTSPWEDFAGLLYAVYYAAAISLVEDPNRPQIGANINTYSLAATYKQEATTRILTCDPSTRSSLESLQATILILVCTQPNLSRLI